MQGVLQVSTFRDQGGAARASLRLHEALERAGGSALLFSDGSSSVLESQGQTHTVTRSRIGREGRRKADRGLMRLGQMNRSAPESLCAVPGVLFRAIDALDPEIVNLHWTAGGGLSLQQVARLRPPVVWTLHDLWPISGVEHYRPALPSPRSRRDLEPAALAYKVRRWPSFDVVAPSRWMQDQAASSPLAPRLRVHHIPNAVPDNYFVARDRQQARARIGLPGDGDVVLFGAELGTTDPRKGFALLQQAMGIVTTVRPKTLFALFGGGSREQAAQLDERVFGLGQLNDDELLATAYGAADMTVVPSTQENLPQTATESQACGTPVVAFDIGGLSDIVVPGTTGQLSDLVTGESLAGAIIRELDSNRTEASRHEISERARRLWSPTVVASAYNELYDDIRASRRDV